MTKQDVIRQLNNMAPELKAMGVKSLSLFGSLARETAHAQSDVDLAVKFKPQARIGAFAFVGIQQRISELLGCPVDLVCEPARKPRMQSEIDRDRVRVF